LHAIFGAAAARQNQNEKLLLRAANAPQKFEAAVMSEVKVQNDGVVMPIADHRFHVDRVRRQINVVIFGAEFSIRKTTERQVAFGDKNTHDCSSGRGKTTKGKLNSAKRHARVKNTSHGKFHNFQK
jgi:hypothetical protein